MPLFYDLTPFLDSRAEICQILGGIFGIPKISKGHSEIIWLNIIITIFFVLQGEDMHILRQNIPRPMSLIAVANQTLECEDNPCSILNGGCEDICQMNSGGHVTCSCHPGRFLIKPGGKRCAYTKKKCQNDAEFQCSQSLDNDPICIPYR